MLITFDFTKRGPSYWKLNTSLLRDPDYIDKINNLLDIQLETLEQNSYRKTWELIKLAVRGLPYNTRQGRRNLSKTR